MRSTKNFEEPNQEFMTQNSAHTLSYILIIFVVAKMPLEKLMAEVAASAFEYPLTEHAQHRTFRTRIAWIMLPAMLSFNYLLVNLIYARFPRRMRFFEKPAALIISLWIAGLGFIGENSLPYNFDKYAIYLIFIAFFFSSCYQMVLARVLSLSFRVREESRWILGFANSCSGLLAALFTFAPISQQQQCGLSKSNSGFYGCETVLITVPIENLVYLCLLGAATYCIHQLSKTYEAKREEYFFKSDQDQQESSSQFGNSILDQNWLVS